MLAEETLYATAGKIPEGRGVSTRGQSTSWQARALSRSPLWAQTPHSLEGTPEMERLKQNTRDFNKCN